MTHLFEKLLRALALLIRALVVMSACAAVGALLNFLVLIAPFLVFGGPRSQEWLRFYGGHNGTYFVWVTAALGILVFPVVRKIRTS